MILALSLAATAFFVAAAVTACYTPKDRRRSRFHAAVQSPCLWSGLCTLTSLPVAYYGHLTWPMVACWPVVAFVVVKVVKLILAVVYRSLTSLYLRWLATFIMPAVWFVLLIAAGALFWIRAVNAIPPVLNQADQLAQSIELAKCGMEHSLDNMSSTLTAFRVPPIDEASDYKQIQIAATQLVGLADRLIEQHDALLAYHDQFLRDFRDAPAMFSAAAQVWHGYAEEERALGMSELAERYDEIAQLWEAYAKAIAETEEDPFSIEELTQVMLFVRRARLLLVRLVQHTSVDSAAEFLSKKAEFETNLRLFIERFDELRGSINSLTRQLQEAPSQSPPSSPQIASYRLWDSTTGSVS